MAVQVKAYIALLEEAIRFGKMDLWKDDLLVHDRRLLLEEPYPDGQVYEPCVEFAWYVCSTGTHIYEADRDDAASLIRYSQHSQLFPDGQWYYWDGVLTPMSATQAAAQCEEAYRRWTGHWPQRYAYDPNPVRVDDGDPLDSAITFAAQQ